ncbi:rhamnosyltransferase [Caballeronia catudaia]|uniref:Rhamnosyltransferase n=1 Tax=Caballeronia catudaia TaxID=1777136 RepID=A0A157ZEX2_9BURK|nr:rhamnosyltransferase [Caballeronia catudaia]SAK44038.1 rhamnosyltransferase [Caballeronia catudaia]
MSDTDAVLQRGRSGNRPRVSAVIVTFNPDLTNVVTILESVRPQVEGIAIVDNASAAGTAEALRQIAAERDCKFIGLTTNVGIGAAQNRGVSELICGLSAATDSEHFILFLDHDSVPQGDMVRELLATDARMREKGVRVGAVGPLTLDKRTHTDGRFMQEGRWWIHRRTCRADCREMKVDFLISSGTLIRVDVLKDVGGMNEGLFIDHVDTEWCLRAVHCGYALFGACRARLLHTLGDAVVRVWMGRWREVFVHSPVRDYYICRNTVAIVRNIPMSLAWRTFLIVRLILTIVFFGAVAAPRIRRLRLMGTGLWDGIVGRSGAVRNPAVRKRQ